MPAATSLHIVVPGLAWPLQALRDLTFDLTLPGLDVLLNAADPLSSVDASPLLAAACQPTAIPAGGAARYKGLGGAPGDERWVCIDPVHIGLQERSIGIEAGDALGLDISEATALATSLAECFAELGEIDATTPAQWHLKLNEHAPAPDLPPLPDVLGASTAGTSLSANPLWRRALNDAQIALHSHPLNSTRASAGRKPVNSLWPWATGRLDPVHDHLLSRLYTNHPAVSGLSRYAGCPAFAVPATLADIDARGDALLLLDALDGPTRRRDAVAWAPALAQLDHDWFTPIAHAWRNGAIDTLTLHFPASGADALHLHLPPCTLLRRLHLRVRPSYERPQERLAR